MGGVVSIGQQSSERKKKNVNRLKEKKRREEEGHHRRNHEREMMKKYGVLIPPIFIANNNSSSEHQHQQTTRRRWEAGGDSVPLCCQMKQKRISMVDNNIAGASSSLLFPSPSSSLLPGPILGDILLNEYMIPGLYVSVPIVNNNDETGGTIMTALHPSTLSSSSSSIDNNNNNNNNNSYHNDSFLSLSKSFNNNNNHDRYTVFPFPWKVEAYIPAQQAIASSSSLSSSSMSNIRIVADLSRRNTNNNTFLSLISQSSLSSSSSSSKSLAWIEGEILRPNWFNMGISYSLGGKVSVQSIRNEIITNMKNRNRNNNNDTNTNTNNNQKSEVMTDFEILSRRLRRQRNNCSSNNYSNDNDAIYVHGAAEWKETIASVNAEIPLSSSPNHFYYSPKVTETMISLNLNGGSGSGGTIRSRGDNNDDDDDNAGLTKKASPPPPPLWLTIKQQGELCRIVNLCQILQFDRPIWNIFEDRPPKRIRNHIGWVCQIEQSLHHHSDLDNNNNNNNNDNDRSSTSPSSIFRNSSNSSSIWSIGLSGQLNKNIAGKIVLETKLGGRGASKASNSIDDTKTNSTLLKFALIMKRWVEPRATLSIINSINLRTGRYQFLGLGLEIENTTSMNGVITSIDDDDNDADDFLNEGRRKVPATVIGTAKKTKK